MPRNWKSTYTGESRYNVLGVTGYILKHAESSAEKMCVVDVGCSRGVALSGARACLEKHHVSVYSMGIDPSPKIASLARTNMDEFVNTDVLEIDWCEKADVVICANVARFVDGEHKNVIFRKCTQLLKSNGILIVSAGRYRKFEREKANNSRPCALCSKSVLHYVWAKVERCMIRDVLSLNKDDAGSFAEHVLKDWTGKSRRKRFMWRVVHALARILEF